MLKTVKIEKYTNKIIERNKIFDNKKLVKNEKINKNIIETKIINKILEKLVSFLKLFELNKSRINVGKKIKIKNGIFVIKNSKTETNIDDKVDSIIKNLFLLKKYSNFDLYNRIPFFI
ncbi:MAG: hypothetical protein NUV32_00505 [Exilispira sp.]|jgi:ribosomal protein L17|nr:hypothetical protein [Exilispira sp.]